MWQNLKITENSREEVKADEGQSRRPYRKSHLLYSVLLVFGDMVCVVLSFALAYWLRFYSGIFPLHLGISDIRGYIQVFIFVLFAFLLVYRSFGLYSLSRHVRRIEEIARTIRASTVFVFVLMAATFIYREFSFSRGVILLNWVCTVILVSLFRFSLDSWDRKRRSTKGEQTKLLILGINKNSRNLIKGIQNSVNSIYEVVGILSEQSEIGVGKHLEGAPIVGSIDEFAEKIKETNADEVILTSSSLPREKTMEILFKCESEMIPFKLVADIYGMITSSVDIEHINSVPLLGLKRLPLDDPWNRLLKRLFDFVLSALGLLTCAPIFLILSILIKLYDGGPVFFKQERVGRDGKTFLLYKFRSMRIDAEKETGPVWAKRIDTRKTKPGELLRRTNLDELPQLWNVLKGDMSLAGPRPERPHFVEQFKEQIPRYMARHKIKSGLTGWAQVNGLRGDTSLSERIKYDLYYMENWSLFLDLEILLKTIFAFKTYKSAY